MVKGSFLSNKIISYISISVFLFLSAELCWSYWNLHHDICDHMEARALALADEVGYAFEALTRYKDNFSLRRVVEQTATIKEVKEVGITDREGRYIVHNRQARIGEMVDHPLLAHVIEDERRQIAYKENEFIVIQPLHGSEYLPEHRSDVIGAIMIAMDLASVNANLHKEFLTAYLGAIIFIVLFSLSIIVIVNRLIVRPIKVLSTATKRLADGNWDVKIPLQSSDEIGELAGSFNQMARDLEDREEILKEKKEELHRSHDKLEKRVEERTAQLSQANEKLKGEIEERKRTEEALKQTLQDLKSTQAQLIQSAKLASIGELSSGVAHELNQPLMVIRSTAQLTQGAIKKNQVGKNELKGQLKKIERNTKRMMNIINHLRTFSRQSSLDFHPVDINEVIENTSLMIGEQLHLHDIEMKKNLTTNLPKIQGDSNQLGQVILNLIINASDAIEAAGNKRQRRIEMVTRMSDGVKGVIEILIIDTGSGISQECLEKIFDPFFTTKKVGKGTGLGLSISHGIIKAHKGEIEVAETGPNGTTFRIKLPIESNEKFGNRNGE